MDVSYKSKIVILANSKNLDIFKADLEEENMEYLCKIERENAPLEAVALS